MRSFGRWTPVALVLALGLALLAPMAATAVEPTAPPAAAPSAPAAPAATPPAATPPVVAAPPPVVAAPGEQDKARPEQTGQAKLAAWKLEIEQITASMARQGMSGRELDATRQRAEQIHQQAQELVAEQTPRLAAIQARLKQLGPAPKADDTQAAAEADSVKDERKAQEALAAELDAVIKGAGIIQLQAEEIATAVATERRDRFSRTLFAKTNSIVDPTLWLDAAVALPRTLNSAALLAADWTRMLSNRASDSAWAILVVAIIASALLLSPVRRRLAQAIDRDTTAEAPAPLRKALAALAIVAMNTLLPFLGLTIVQWTFRLLELSPERVDNALGAVVWAVTAASGITGLSYALLAPAKPHWRIAAVADADSHELHRLFVALAVVYAVGAFAVDLAAVLVAPVALQVVLTGVSALFDVSLVMLILRSLARALAAEPEPAPAGAPAATETTGGGAALWRWLLPLTWLAALVSVAAVLVGYVTLARFVVTEIVWVGAALSILYLLLIVIDRAIAALVEPGTRTADTLVRSMGLSRSTVEQLSVVLSGLLRVTVILAALVAIAGPLGVSVFDARAFARQLFFGINVGGLTISLSAILVGIVVFAVVLALTRSGQRWLEDSFLPRTQLDSGLKNSIRTAFGYAGFVLALIFGLSSVGINLSNIAIVAGALSVGIGFGLQSIVNNFVSGLILLAERPMKTGDMVEIAGGERGIVRKINVRATEIETFDRASLIVPNSTIISGNVKNWMHRDQTGRSLVTITVGYDADPKTVKEIMLACAADHPLALIFPAPGCHLTAFDTEFMRFQLVCTVAKVGDAFGVESDLRFAVLERLRQAGVPIGRTPPELHVAGLADTLDGLRAVLESETRAAAAPESPKP
jgi:small-conductance mechanosensitive channel